MKKIELTAFDLAGRFLGLKEIPGGQNHPLISWWHSLCGEGLATPDEVPWCSAAMNGVAFLLGLPRSGSPAARSWLAVGAPVGLGEAEAGNDVVVLYRGNGVQPGPEVLAAPGHVGLFGSFAHGSGRILIRGGNQGDEFNDSWFPAERILGIRRLIE